MASGVHLTTDSDHLSNLRNQLRMPTYAHNVSTAQPFAFANTATSPLWSHVDFVPEEIVDLSVTMDGLRFYKVQWRESWVAEHQLLPHVNVLRDFWSKRNEQNISSNTNNLSAPQVTTLSKTTTNLSQKNTEETVRLNVVSKTNCLPTTKPESVIVPSEGGATSSTSRSEVSLMSSNNDLSGNKSSEHRVDPTLAPVVESVDLDKCKDVINSGGNRKTLPPAQIISDQKKSSTSNIHKVILSQPKNLNDNGKSVQCNGIEILGIKNTNATEAEIQEKAQEFASSFKRKRRKYESGDTYNNSDTCFFCHKELSSGKHLRQHIFNVHLKNFGEHKCELCQSKFFYKRTLKVHMKSHSEERNIICKVCKMTFKFSSALYKHMKTHEKESNFRCDVCHKNFKVQADLKTHCLEEHRNQITECNVCKQKLLTGNSVYLHSMRHSGMREFACDQCGQRFKRKQHLMRHKVIHTSGMLACPYCEKKMKLKTTLVNHIRIFHREHSEQYYKGKYTCGLCKKEYKDKGALDWHIKHVHGEETQKEDFDMEKTVESLQKKMKTMERMKGSKLQKALKAIDMCDEELSQLSHKIGKITNPVTGDVRLSCKMCRESFVLVSVMLKHLQDHRDGKVKVFHVCKDCGVKFTNKFHLQQHRKIHIVPKKKAQNRAHKKGQTPQAPNPQKIMVEDIRENVEKITYSDGKVKFKCKICPKREFQMVRAMKKHLQEHKNDQSTITDIKGVEHLCEECGKSFKTKKRLQLHEKISHQMSNSCGDNSGNEDVDNQNVLKMNQKRKKHVPIHDTLNTTGKRSAALNANSILRLQLEEVFLEDDDRQCGKGEIIVVEGSDHELGDDFEVLNA